MTGQLDDPRPAPYSPFMLTLGQWDLDAEFVRRLAPLDNLLATSPFLAGDHPLFLDYDLYGILGNYLYNGKTKIPPLKNLHRWHRQMM